MPTKQSQNIANLFHNLARGKKGDPLVVAFLQLVNNPTLNPPPNDPPQNFSILLIDAGGATCTWPATCAKGGKVSTFFDGSNHWP